MTSPAIDLEQVPRISDQEYVERQLRAAAFASEHGCDGLVAWSRGGSTQDRYADVYYLTGFYSHFPTLHDEPGIGRARGHCATVIAADGSTELITDVRQLRTDDAPVATRINYTSDVIEGLADALRRQIPREGRVALLGGDVLAHRWQQSLSQLLPRHRLCDADSLGCQLRLVKSPAELELMRAAGKVGTAAVDAAMNAAGAGVTEAQVASAAVDVIISSGAAFYGLGLSSGAWAHTFSPTRPAAFDGRRRLHDGDMLRLDLYGSVDGYMFDFGRSLVIGGQANDDQQAILDVVISSVQAGIDVIKPGIPIGQIAARCEAELRDSSYAQRFEISDSPLGSWGHSLGLCWEAPWIETTNELPLSAGMCLAVELRIEAPGVGGANFEQNVIVTDTGCELLTQARIQP